MLEQLRIATMMTLLLTILTGGIYPLVITGLAQAVFPYQANGSLIRDDQGVAGSKLIGQSFTKPEYFWGRLSGTSPIPYNAASSSGTNFGPLHPDLKAAAASRVSALQVDGQGGPPVPVDLVTASGSGLDPHLSPAGVEFQIARVATARGLPNAAIRKLVAEATTDRLLGVLGEPVVNILQLNRALDQYRPRN